MPHHDRSRRNEIAASLPTVRLLALANRFSSDLSTLRSLESLGPSNQAAYWLPTMYASLLGGALTDAAPAVVELRALTADIYRLSSASNNAAPGTYPSPVDTLRNFIATGALYSTIPSPAHARCWKPPD